MIYDCLEYMRSDRFSNIGIDDRIGGYLTSIIESGELTHTYVFSCTVSCETQALLCQDRYTMIYQPLAEGCFRLLCLQGDEFEATLECTLEHVLFQPRDSRAYETISYSWGSDTTTTEISLHGNKVRIPRNAAEALHRLRPTDNSTRILWIDSVCIDQHNLDERNQQVTMMADIYRHATRNLIWLGEDDGTVKTALSNVEILTSDIMVKTDSLATFPLVPDSNHHFHQSSGIDVEFDAQSIIRLISRPWFSRLWVVQEVALAKSNLCHCGPWTFDLIPLLRVAKWLWTKRLHIRLHGTDDFALVRQIFASVHNLHDVVDEDLGFFHIAVKKGWFDERDVTAPWFSILDMTTIFNATQPVDHVFAVLGLWQLFSPIRTGLPALLLPDYFKSVSEVFRDATRYAIMESESLALWQNLHRRPKDDSILPTWVRRWDRSFDPHHDPTPFHRGFWASGDWIGEKFDPAPDLPNSIVLEGIFIDAVQGSQVDVVSEVFSDPHFGPRFVDEIKNLIYNHPETKEKYDLEVALRTTLVAAENAERDVATEDDLRGLDDLQQHFWSKNVIAPSFVQLSSDSEYIEAPAHIRRAARYGEAAWRMCFLRRFFVTAAGKIGLGPQTMQSGDFAVVVYGCEWPVILRCDQDTKTYQLIGTAWIYGIMKGEAVQEHDVTYGEDAENFFTIV